MAAHYEFIKQAGRTIKSRQSNTVILTGNVDDDFLYDGKPMPLMSTLKASLKSDASRILISYEPSLRISFDSRQDYEAVRTAWAASKAASYAIPDDRPGRPNGNTSVQKWSEDFDDMIVRSKGDSRTALEALRQICLAAAELKPNGDPRLERRVIVVIGSFDMLVPESEASRLSEADRRRVSTCRTWFSDPDFIESQNAVIMVSESVQSIHSKISKLPRLVEVEIPSPDRQERLRVISWFNEQRQSEGQEPIAFRTGPQELSAWTAGLSNQALLQLLRGAAANGGDLCEKSVTDKVEAFVKSQLGQDVVEFKKPSHKLDDLVGNTLLIEFLRQDLIPDFRSGEAIWSSVVVGGPIGGGKTFVFEAVASELGFPVLILKNLRSKWFGETDVILGRLKRLLDSLARALIFIDEADTMFSSASTESHSTEKRVSGQIFQMMSDPRLKGKIYWLLMSARVHLLPADIVRPGRGGDLIIAVTDPEKDDRTAFLQWATKGLLASKVQGKSWAELGKLTANYSAASFDLLRRELGRAAKRTESGKLKINEVLKVTGDILPSGDAKLRRYQAIQAILRCSRLSLLPKNLRQEEMRETLREEALKLEQQGVR